MLEAINDGIKQHNLLTSERVLLEQTLKGSIKALTEVLAMANPAAFGRGTRVCQAALRISSELEVPELWQVEVAAMLSQIGCITLPQATTARLHSGEPLSPQEKLMVERMPLMTCNVMEPIPRLESVGKIIRIFEYVVFAPDFGSLRGEYPKFRIVFIIFHINMVPWIFSEYGPWCGVGWMKFFQKMLLERLGWKILPPQQTPHH